MGGNNVEKDKRQDYALLNPTESPEIQSLLSGGVLSEEALKSLSEKQMVLMDQERLEYYRQFISRLQQNQQTTEKALLQVSTERDALLTAIKFIYDNFRWIEEAIKGKTKVNPTKVKLVQVFLNTFQIKVNAALILRLITEFKKRLPALKLAMNQYEHFVLPAIQILNNYGIVGAPSQTQQKVVTDEEE